MTLKQFEALTGYTVDATNSKIKRGDWLEGAVFIKAPDGRNLIDLEGYEEWVVQGRAASGKFHKAASR
ncbi:TPA: excisionase [Stenotrophomonas maltophilia]|uniref:excisionase n=1 Tax=Stenotrophomonas maltophilia TaxID=40324 RepID=UPI002B1E8FFF|nr:excisionase [Stenotrophomonas maltophilia]